MSGRTWMAMAGILGALGVTCGAFGAHLLPGWLEAAGLDTDQVAQRMETFQIGVRYHMYHAIGLLAVGLWAQRVRSRALTFAGFAFTAGVVLFSGLLYAITLTGIGVLGAVVPIGGSLLIAGWIAVAVAAAGSGNATVV